MSKANLKSTLILKIVAGGASAKAPLGPTLGQYSIPIADFCNKFNALTESYKNSIILKTTVYLYEDQTYEISIGNPDASFFIKKTVHEETGSQKAGKYKINTNSPNKKIITSKMLYEIAKTKYEGGLNKTYYKLESLHKAIAGTARSMGIIVVPTKEIKKVYNQE